MAVPGHDQRDWEFAAKFELEIKEVIKPADSGKSDLSSCAYEDYGTMINSEEFDGLSSSDGKKKVTEKKTITKKHRSDKEKEAARKLHEAAACRY